MARIYQGSDPCAMRVGDQFVEINPGDEWPGSPDAQLSGDWVEAPPAPSTPAKRTAEKD
jgi:hypothetical protein